LDPVDLYILTLSEDLTPQGEPKRLTFDNPSWGRAWTKDGRAIVFTSGMMLFSMDGPGNGWMPNKPNCG
jgi:Tol biopolymer transport system component